MSRMSEANFEEILQASEAKACVDAAIALLPPYDFPGKDKHAGALAVVMLDAGELWIREHVLEILGDLERHQRDLLTATGEAIVVARELKGEKK